MMRLIHNSANLRNVIYLATGNPPTKHCHELTATFTACRAALRTATYSKAAFSGAAL
jgi:hypothetical protein